MKVEEVFQKYTRVIRVRIHQKFRQHSNSNRIELASPFRSPQQSLNNF